MAGSIQDDIRRFQLEINTSSKNGETLAQLTKLEKETGKLRSENTELQKVMAHLSASGQKGTAEYKKFEAQLKNNRKTIKQNADEMKGLQKNLDLNYMSMGQLKKRAGELRSTLNSMSKAADPEGYNKLEKELGQVGTQMDKLKGKTNKTKGVFKTLIGTAGGFLAAFSFQRIFSGMKTFFVNADEKFEAFQERVNNLSALTKLEGNNLKWLADEAKKTSSATIEGNIRISQSAKNIVDAYTVVGSKRPALLKSKEALAAVTKDAIILSNAAKGPLSDSVSGLTTAMNQFSLAADQSRRVINILGAGSQVGAGDIAYLNAAMEKSGTTANLMGVEMEEWTGAIETVAPFFAEAATAGNSFDKVLLTLKEKQIGYTDGVFNLNDALNELEVRYEKGESASSIFGKEHAKMGEILVKNKDQIIQYTKDVTDTNVALTQASINTNNEAAKRAQALNKIENASINLGKAFAPLITQVIKFGGKLADLTSNSPVQDLEEQRRKVNALTFELNSAELPMQRRNEIYKELQTIAPEVVKGIDQENINYIKLTKNLETYNDLAIKRIALKKMEIELDGKRDELADIYNKKREAEIDVIEDISNSYKYKDIALDNSLSKEEKLQKVMTLVNKEEEERKRSSLGSVRGQSVYVQSADPLYIKYLSLNKLNSDYNNLYQDLLDSQKSYQEELNQSINTKVESIDSEGGDNDGGGNGGTNPNTVETNEQDILDIRKKYGLLTKNELLEKEIKDFEESEDYKVLTAEDRAKIILGIRIKYWEKERTAIDPDLEAGDLDTSDLDASNEAEMQAMLDFEEKKKEAIKKYRQFSVEELQAEEMNLLQNAYDEKLISEEIFQQAKAEIEQRFADEQAEKDSQSFQDKLAKYQEYIAVFSMVAQGASEIVQNLQDAEFEDLDARQEKGLISDEQYEAEALKIKKKYADKQFIAAIANILASTAQGVMQSFAQFGPILGGVLSAIPIAAGVTQGLIANKQRKRVQSMADGGFSGYTGPGSKYEKAQLTQLHKNEYIIPSEGVNNPDIQSFIQLMEQQRVAGTLSSMNMPNVTGAREGGYQSVTAAQPGNTIVSESQNNEVMLQMVSVLDRLQRFGVLAKMDNQGARDIKELNDEDTEFLSKTKFL